MNTKRTAKAPSNRPLWRPPADSDTCEWLWPVDPRPARSWSSWWLATGARPVAEVLQRQLEHDADVGVVERVVDHPPGAPVADDAGRAQQAQGVRHRGLRDVGDLGDVGDVEVAVLQEGVEDAGPRRVA